MKCLYYRVSLDNSKSDGLELHREVHSVKSADRKIKNLIFITQKIEIVFLRYLLTLLIPSPDICAEDFSVANSNSSRYRHSYLISSETSRESLVMWSSTLGSVIHVIPLYRISEFYFCLYFMILSSLHLRHSSLIKWEGWGRKSWKASQSGRERLKRRTIQQFLESNLIENNNFQTLNRVMQGLPNILYIWNLKQ